MKSWTDLTADVTQIMNRHYTPGRQGRKINKIVVHHNAGNLSVKDCYQVWQTRQASAHYQVEKSGRIGQLVHDADTAWHAGTWDTNLTSIGIEHANDKGAPAWTISEATLNNGAHLVAALCVFYKLGRPTWGVNIFPHQHFQATACPGAIWGSQKNAYMVRSQKYYDEMTDFESAGKPADKPSVTRLSVDGYLGTITIACLQRVLGTKADGMISGQDAGNTQYFPTLTAVGYSGGGSPAIIALQRKLGVVADGLLGPKTIKAWQRTLGVKPDGYLGQTTAKAIQKALNTGKAW